MDSPFISRLGNELDLMNLPDPTEIKDIALTAEAWPFQEARALYNEKLGVSLEEGIFYAIPSSRFCAALCLPICPSLHESDRTRQQILASKKQFLF